MSNLNKWEKALMMEKHDRENVVVCQMPSKCEENFCELFLLLRAAVGSPTSESGTNPMALRLRATPCASSKPFTHGGVRKHSMASGLSTSLSENYGAL